MLPLCKPGDRIKLIRMGKDPAPIPVGTTGTVLRVQCLGPVFPSCWQIHVNWDIQRSLMLVYPDDIFEIIETSPTEPPTKKETNT